MSSEIIVSLGKHQRGCETKRIEISACGRQAIISFDLNRASQRYIYEVLSHGAVYEARAVEVLMGLLGDGGTFFDVGAHIGYFSVFGALISGSESNVIAFEPAPENLPYLRVNFGGEIIAAAVADAEGSSNLFVNADNDGGSALWDVSAHQDNVSCHGETVPVKRVTLDSFEGRKPNAIKIDTEGAEVLILRGAERLLGQSQLRLVICEINPFGLAWMRCRQHSIFGIMKRHGFKAEYSEGGGRFVQNAIFTR